MTEPSTSEQEVSCYLSTVELRWVGYSSEPAHPPLLQIRNVSFQGLDIVVKGPWMTVPTVILDEPDWREAKYNSPYRLIP